MRTLTSIHASFPPHANIVRSLRTTSNIPNGWEGTAYASVLYFDLQWAWLVVPMLAIILAFIFLLLTISQSHRYQIPAWKSSQVAAMQSLSPEVREAVGDLGIKMSTRDRTHDIIVRLVHEDGKWQLVKSPFGADNVG